MKLRHRQRGFWNFVIPAVAAVAGSVLNKKSQEKASQQAAEATRDANQANVDFQKEFAQHGISWKVQDAKEAGLHPLFGAGLSGSSFSPSFQTVPTQPASDFSWLAQVGQLLGNFLGGSQGSKQAQVKEAFQGDPSQRVTITEYPDGTRTIVRPVLGLESQVSGRPLDAPLELVSAPGGTQFVGGIYQKPMTDPLAKSHVANVKDDPFWQRFSFGPNFGVILPKTSEPQEVFEDKPLWFWAMVAKANVREYGPGWLTQARRQFPSLREVYDGVVQELKTSGILDALPSVNVPWR